MAIETLSHLIMKTVLKTYAPGGKTGNNDTQVDRPQHSEKKKK
jgi:hypothetical protein